MMLVEDMRCGMRLESGEQWRKEREGRLGKVEVG